MSPQIRTVGHGLIVNIQQHVVQIQSSRQRCSRRHLESGQIHNLRLLACREQIAQSDLIGGADHAEGLHAPQLGIFDFNGLSLAVPAHHSAGAGYGYPHSIPQIDSTADDLLDLSVSNIHLADSQPVRVWMGLHLFDHAYYHLIKTTGQVLYILHLYRGHGQIVGQLLQIHIIRDLHIVPNPR